VSRLPLCAPVLALSLTMTGSFLCPTLRHRSQAPAAASALGSGDHATFICSWVALPSPCRQGRQRSLLAHLGAWGSMRPSCWLLAV